MRLTSTRIIVLSLVLFTAMSSRASGQEVEESSDPETKFAANVAATDGGQSATDGGRPASGPRHRPFVIGVFGLPLVTHLGPLGPRGAETVSPADRFAITQIVGGGYVLNRHVLLRSRPFGSSTAYRSASRKAIREAQTRSC